MPLEFLHDLPKWLNLVILLAAFAGAVFALRRTVYIPTKALYDKINSGMDTLLGYPPVMDPGSGKELKAATPALALRVDNLEEANVSIAGTLKALAETHQQVIELSQKWDEREMVGTKIISEWTQWRDRHEHEADMREQRLAEWEQWRQEQTLMMEAIKKAQGLPTKDVDP